MPALSSSEALMELIRKSGVVDQKKLEMYLEKARRAGCMPDDLGKFASILVRDGLLTWFQAEQLLQGKWRRFSIGKYKVLERIGSGSMGSVYLCQHRSANRAVAVKVLPSCMNNNNASVERFYREARALAALSHSNTVRVFDIDQDDDLHFLVMEYVDGSNLQDVVGRSGPLEPIRAANYIGQAAQGLEHAHETAGIVHRDIEPANLVVDRSGVLRIVDFGLAFFVGDELDLLAKKCDDMVLGTIDYIAPEQARDSHSVDIRADIYALGATFYFCLTGRPPFVDGTDAEKLIWHQRRHAKPIWSLRADVPEMMSAVVERMMAKDPDQRYPTPQSVAEALVPWTQQPIAPPSEDEMPRMSPAALSVIGAKR
jgi:serine/threonine protein kinase